MYSRLKLSRRNTAKTGHQKPLSFGYTMSKDYQQLAKQIKTWAKDLGFDKVGITDIDLSKHERHLQNWLSKNFHGEMKYMEAHGTKRSRPNELIPNTIRIISVAMNYLPKDSTFINALKNPYRAYISRYALGRDYHKIIKKNLNKLAIKIKEVATDLDYRAFVDSAPVLEKALAEKAGLGWIGKHSNLISKDESSWFFLGELFTNIPLPIDQPYKQDLCGTCQACIDVCPTNAIVGPKQVDARRCISYLTIELKTSIPVELRPLMGNRIYGCDDCQIVCPWNKFAKATTNDDFKPRHDLEVAELLELFKWDAETFLKKTEGSAIRRTGYEGWMRNIAVALGNAPFDLGIINALKEKKDHTSELIREHVEWALAQQEK